MIKININSNRDMDALDILSIISFISQFQNIEENKKESNYIHEVIKSISNEIDKLHKENDDIIFKLNKILEKIGDE